MLLAPINLKIMDFFCLHYFGSMRFMNWFLLFTTIYKVSLKKLPYKGGLWSVTPKKLIGSRSIYIYIYNMYVYEGRPFSN